MSYFKSFLLSIFLLPTFSFAGQEPIYEKPNKVISSRYIAGPYLIYQCENKHFACISLLNYQECEEARETSIKRKESRLSCAPLRKFENPNKCLQWLYQEIHAVRDVEKLCRLNTFKH